MDQKTFIDHFKPAQDTMYLLAKRLLCSHDEAADAVQETMAKLWSKKEMLPQVKNKKGYAVQMVKNYCLDRLKSKQASHLSIVHSNYKDDNNGVDIEMQRESQIIMVRKMINLLPENYRMIIHLRDIKQYDYEAIEHIMEMKSTAVRVALSRARKMLKEKIEEHYFTEIA